MPITQRQIAERLRINAAEVSFALCGVEPVVNGKPRLYDTAQAMQAVEKYYTSRIRGAKKKILKYMAIVQTAQKEAENYREE